MRMRFHSWILYQSIEYVGSQATIGLDGKKRKRRRQSGAVAQKKVLH